MWLKYIEDGVGADHILQIVTDGAATNRQVGMDVVVKKYPHITWNWCAAHVLNLLLEDMCGHMGIVLDEAGCNPFKPIFIHLKWIVKAISM